MFKLRPSHFIRHFHRRKLLFGFPDRADLGNGIDTGRDIFHQMRAGFAFNHRLCRNAALVVRRGCQARVANHIADGINAEGQRVGIPGTAIGVKQAIGFDFFTGLQVHDHPVVQPFDALILFIVANHHAAVPEVVRERIGHLLIEER